MKLIPVCLLIMVLVFPVDGNCQKLGIRVIKGIFSTESKLNGEESHIRTNTVSSGYLSPIIEVDYNSAFGGEIVLQIPTQKTFLDIQIGLTYINIDQIIKYNYSSYGYGSGSNWEYTYPLKSSSTQISIEAKLKSDNPIINPFLTGGVGFNLLGENEVSEYHEKYTSGTYKSESDRSPNIKSSDNFSFNLLVGAGLKINKLVFELKYFPTFFKLSDNDNPSIFGAESSLIQIGIGFDF